MPRAASFYHPAKGLCRLARRRTRNQDKAPRFADNITPRTSAAVREFPMRRMDSLRPCAGGVGIPDLRGEDGGLTTRGEHSMLERLAAATRAADLAIEESRQLRLASQLQIAAARQACADTMESLFRMKASVEALRETAGTAARLLSHMTSAGLPLDGKVSFLAGRPFSSADHEHQDHSQAERPPPAPGSGRAHAHQPAAMNRSARAACSTAERSPRSRSIGL